jgi:D-sedoheptulose 7-phosphate isomerase
VVDRLTAGITRRSFAGLSAMLPQALAATERPVAEAVSTICKALRAGRKVMFCGNGGSAADAQHLATELVGKFYRQRRALPALSLTTDTSVLTAIGNDDSFAEVFSRQVEAIGKRGDVLVCISTSGKSRNVLAAARLARQMGLKVIALLGSHTRSFAATSDTIISVPSKDTPRVQELHGLIGHIICQAVEQALT